MRCLALLLRLSLLFFGCSVGVAAGSSHGRGGLLSSAVTSAMFLLFSGVPLWWSPAVVTCVAGAAVDGPVRVTLAKVWPAGNPSETYAFPSVVPLCGFEWSAVTPSLGELLAGERPIETQFRVGFRRESSEQLLCVQRLEGADLQRLRNAVLDNYLFEINLDGLPVVQALGDVRGRDQKPWLLTRWKFVLGFNEDDVVSASLKVSPDDFEPVDGELHWRYSVHWSERPEILVPERLIVQLQAQGIAPRPQAAGIHWIAIGNAAVLALFVAGGLLVLILRTVRKDVARYLRLADEELLATDDDTGWKLLHADVFRAPPHRMWLCACVGSGAHLLFTAVVTCLVWSARASSLAQRNTALSVGLCFYLLTSFIAGYISANLYRRLGGNKWGLNILVTVFMFTGPVLAIWAVVNSVAAMHRSTAALPFSTVAFLGAWWLFVTLPLLVMGAVTGRRHANTSLESERAFPCRANRLAREIPRVPLRWSPWLHTLFSGVLPFSTLYIELYFVFSSMWGGQTYTLSFALLLSFVLLLAVAASVSMLLTYFHLNLEDYRWWWRSLLSGGSVAFFFLLFCFAYFKQNTQMHGPIQTAFFAGFSLAASWGLFLAVGFVTFTANYYLLKYLYSSVKCE